MAIISQLELVGSPVEQASWSAGTFYWDPSGAQPPAVNVLPSPVNELGSGETISAPTAKVLQYDPAYAANVADAKDVSSTVLASGSPTIGTGAHANQVKVALQANALVPGLEYRIQLTCTGSLGATPARFFRVRCRV